MFLSTRFPSRVQSLLNTISKLTLFTRYHELLSVLSMSLCVWSCADVCPERKRKLLLGICLYFA